MKKQMRLQNMELNGVILLIGYLISLQIRRFTTMANVGEEGCGPPALGHGEAHGFCDPLALA